MNDDICFLLTLTDGNVLQQVALKVRREKLRDDCIDYPMEPENRDQLFDLLPLHVQEFGKIVAVEEIFEVVVKK